MNLCLQKSHFRFYHYKRMAVIRHRKVGHYWLCSHLLQAKRQMVTVLFDLQYFGVKNLTATIQIMKVTQCCPLDTWQRAMNFTEVGVSRAENSLKEWETELRKNLFFHVEKWSQYACLDCKSRCWCVYYIEHSACFHWFWSKDEFINILNRWQRLNLSF